MGLDHILAAGGSWTTSRKNRRWLLVGVDKPLLRTFKCICSQLGLEELLLLHFTAAFDTTALASEEGAAQTECHQGHGGAGGQGDRTRTRSGAAVAWESHLGRGCEWMEEEEGWKECVRRADGALEAAPGLLSPRYFAFGCMQMSRVTTLLSHWGLIELRRSSLDPCSPAVLSSVLQCSPVSTTSLRLHSLSVTAWRKPKRRQANGRFLTESLSHQPIQWAEPLFSQ